MSADKRRDSAIKEATRAAEAKAEANVEEKITRRVEAAVGAVTHKHNAALAETLRQAAIEKDAAIALARADESRHADAMIADARAEARASAEAMGNICAQPAAAERHHAQVSSSLDARPSEERLTRSLMAFRQYVDFKRETIQAAKKSPAGKMANKPWYFLINREPRQLVRDVLDAFGKLSHSTRARLFSTSVVTFVDAWGVKEEGVDEGGLTAEMYSSFWRHAVRPDVGLFESGAEGCGCMPQVNARIESLESVGLVMAKCVLDDHPLGSGLCPFVLSFLVHGMEAAELREPEAALAALAQVDPALAQSWRALVSVESDVELMAMGLKMGDFLHLDANIRAGARVKARFLASSEGETQHTEYYEGTAAVVHADGTVDVDYDDGDQEKAVASRYVELLQPADVAITLNNIRRAVLEGVRERLLGERRPALLALRRGFQDLEDLTVQLAALSDEHLQLMLQGRVVLSATDLLSCFELPSASVVARAESGFTEASAVPELFERLLLDDTVFDEARRLRMLQWCTSLGALPSGGLADKITLKLFSDAGDDALPMVHTCTREMHLPEYRSFEQLQAKLLQALEHSEDGFLMDGG